MAGSLCAWRVKSGEGCGGSRLSRTCWALAIGNISRVQAGEEPFRCQLGRGPLPPCRATCTCPAGDRVGALPEGRAHLQSTSLSVIRVLSLFWAPSLTNRLKPFSLWKKPFSLFSCHPAQEFTSGPPLCHLHPHSQLSADSTFNKRQTLVRLLMQGCPPLLLKMLCSLPELERPSLLRCWSVSTSRRFQPRGSLPVLVSPSPQPRPFTALCGSY